MIFVNQVIPGIGFAYAKRLKEVGYEKVYFRLLILCLYIQMINLKKAYHLFGQYLILQKDEQKFIRYLKEKFFINYYNAKIAYKCLNEYCFEHI
jgi:hypothetical protein